MKIWLAPPDLSTETPNYVAQVLKAGWVAPNGPENRKFEALIAEFHDLKPQEVVSCASGTAALHLVYRALDLQKKDVVFLPTLNFVAALNPLLIENAIPWFVDSEELTGGISPELFQKAILDSIKKGLKPKAVVVVHLLGFPAQISRIREIVNRYNMILIEDAAESLGAEIHQKPTQYYADFSVLSFNGNKTITCSGGGAVLCKSADKMLEIKNLIGHYKKAEVPFYWHEKPGFNYALSNISAAIGVSEWNSIQEKLNKKAQIYSWYNEAFSEMKLPVEMFPIWANGKSSFWMNCIFLDETKRDKVYELLKSKEIESRYLWTPLHLMPFAKDFPKTLNGTAEKWAKQGLCLPSGTGITKQQVWEIAELIEKGVKV